MRHSAGEYLGVLAESSEGFVGVQALHRQSVVSIKS